MADNYDNMTREELIQEISNVKKYYRLLVNAILHRSVSLARELNKDINS